MHFVPRTSQIVMFRFVKVCMEDRLQAKLSYHPISRLVSPLVAIEQASFQCLMKVNQSHQPMAVITVLIAAYC